MNSQPTTRRFRPGRALGVLFLLVIAATLVGALVVRHLLHASLARLDGQLPLNGLTAAVTIERDALGVPTIHASNRVDAARALGFVHAQERFFQMDLLRRRGAGELAALLGPALVEVDQGIRRHGLRAVARDTMGHLPAVQRAVADAYAAGVNAGLAALGARPPEYLLLRAVPEPWRAEDCVLVGFAMFFTLQDETGGEDLGTEVAARALPPAVADFFYPAASEWDAAIDNSLLPVAPIPGPELINFASPPPQASARPRSSSALAQAEPDRSSGRPGADQDDSDLVAGSNSWGVQGAASATGSAIICDDMHLELGVPNIWFRVCLQWPEADGRIRRVVGASLAGVPSLIVGSNGDLAWGFTNATVDNTDLAIVEVDPANPHRYRTPDGWRDFEDVEAVIAVRGEASRSFRFQRTIWGPVVDEAGPNRKLALCWTPHRSGGADLGLLALETARSVGEALTLAPRCGIPVQNLLVGDRAGELAWTLIGRLPKRVGFDGSMPTALGDGAARWDSWWSVEETPRFVAPAGGRLWTANNRILGTPPYLSLGTRYTDVGARARQIRDDLLALKAPVSEPDLLSIHRDDRALFLTRWQQLLLRVLEGPPPEGDSTNAARWAEARTAVREWGGRATTNSVGYRLARAFRLNTMNFVLAPVLARCETVRRGAALRNDRQESPVWALLEARPAHLLNPRFGSWDALLANAVKAGLDDLERQHVPLHEATWGRRNTLRLAHPLTRAVPQLGRWLNFDPVELPGDSHMPRVQGPAFGASERMVVSPGHEERGIFHMPGGQSGHFLSPFYRAGHQAWVNVEPTPLLPGPAEHRLELLPAAQP